MVHWSNGYHSIRTINTCILIFVLMLLTNLQYLHATLITHHNNISVSEHDNVYLLF